MLGKACPRNGCPSPHQTLNSIHQGHPRKQPGQACLALGATGWGGGWNYQEGEISMGCGVIFQTKEGDGGEKVSSSICSAVFHT